jgi:hypothetical protein
MNLQAQMEKRRKRRKESNRESARRSRLRKRQHLDDLNSQVLYVLDHISLKIHAWYKHIIHFLLLFTCINKYIYISLAFHKHFLNKSKWFLLRSSTPWQQVNQLKDQNKQLGVALRVTRQNLVTVQAHNSVLQTQKMELVSRLGPLTEILSYLNAGTTTTTSSAVNNDAAIMNNNSLTTTTTSGACDVLGATTWNQPVDCLYYRCF